MVDRSIVAYDFNAEVKRFLTSVSEKVIMVEHVVVSKAHDIDDDTIITFLSLMSDLSDTNVFFSRVEESCFILVIFIFEDAALSGDHISRVVAGWYTKFIESRKLNKHEVKTQTFLCGEDIEEMDSENFAVQFIEAHEAYLYLTGPSTL